MSKLSKKRADQKRRAIARQAGAQQTARVAPTIRDGIVPMPSPGDVIHIRNAGRAQGGLLSVLTPSSFGSAPMATRVAPTLATRPSARGPARILETYVEHGVTMARVRVGTSVTYRVELTRLSAVM